MVFDCVKKAFTHSLLLTLFGVSFCHAQSGVNKVTPLNFADSVRVAFENTRSVDAIVIGGSFFSAWGSIAPDQQKIIQKQTLAMRKKKYKLRPSLIDYFGALANAINIEHIDASKLSNFLTVSEQVIQNYNNVAASNFFAISKTFFQYHVLHYDKSYRLHVIDDNYSFEFIALPPPPGWNDTTNTETKTEADASTGIPIVVDDQPSDTVQQTMPSWMTPPPPPYVDGAVIRFTTATLNFVTRYDSVFLKNTKGIFAFRENLFIGEQGSFSWAAAGLNPDSVNCNFTTYNFNVSKPEFKTDIVNFNYVGRTPGYIPGNFEFKSQPRKDSVPSAYPRFKSYQSGLEIKGIGNKNVKYKGGFSLTGRLISSQSVGGDLGVIEVSDDEKKKFTARSSEFKFSDSTIISNQAMISIYQDNDSISHPQIRMKYTFKPDSAQRLLLLKQKGPMSNTPYSATLFDIDFSADRIEWNLKSDSMNLQVDGGRNTVPVIVQSINFYDGEDFRLLRGQGFSFHPLALVVGYCLTKRVREFYTGDLARYANKDQLEINKAVEFLSQKGMVNYNPRTSLVRVKQKSIDFYRSYKGEGDYDNLKIHSVIDSMPNASISFSKRSMTLRGVREFRVSDSLFVKIDPDSAFVTILPNRDIKFNGTINAGNFQITGKSFTLKYDSFNIDLAHIDSINFYVTEKNAKGQTVRRKVNNSMVSADSTAAAAGGLGDISRSSGTLFINKPNNKSGKKKIPNYPRLDASTGGVIYYDGDEVLNGAYDRSMFFVVPPFKLDSLSDADPASINFEGTFVSSGMLPNFKEKLHTMSDKSLGFTHPIPKSGYQLYNGEGILSGGLTMNNRGLRSNGKIEYFGATAVSPEFIFYPDSVYGRGARAKIDEKTFGSVFFPQASLPDYEMKWYPKKDQMIFKNKKAPFNFYDSTAQLKGSVTVSKNGVTAAGKLETRGTELISRQMNFESKDFRARHAKFKVNTEIPDKPLLAGNDIRLRFNLEQNFAELSPEIEGTAAVDFPYAQFKTSIPKMRWDLNTQKISMSKDKNTPLENSYFYTTRKDLDSLRFNAESAEYDLKTQELKVSGIPFIIVADAKITPENNEVLILENAKIGTLKNTKIELDTLNGYHHLTDGVVDIVSRKEFSGHATYQYVNLLKDTFAIKMSDFRLEPIQQVESKRKAKRKKSKATMQTVATGVIEEAQKMVLGGGMFYKGDMTMYATKPALQLTGYVKLDIKKIKDYNTWIRYEQSGDEDSVNIDFDHAVTEDGRQAQAGLLFSTLDNELYITFLNDKKYDEDESFFEPSGTLYFDSQTKEYKIEDLQKADGNKLSGKVFSYNDENSQVRFEGPVKLFNGGKDFNVTSTTLGAGNLETNEIRMNSLIMVDSNIPSQAFDYMAKSIQNVIKNEGSADGLGDQTELLYKIADIVGERVAKDYEEKSLKGYVSLGALQAMARPLVFPSVSLKWSVKQKAFYSEGDLGLSNIGRNDINGSFEGFMEIKKTADGSPVFNVFIKASPEAWYYFGFEDNRIQVQSSDDNFNTVIAKKSNAAKVKVGEVAFIPGSDDEVLAFINRFKKDYYGIDVPYSLSDASTSAVEKKPEVINNLPPPEVIEKGKKKKKKSEEPSKLNEEEKEKTPEKKKEDDGF